jgi:hypothetical protein
MNAKKPEPWGSGFFVNGSSDYLLFSANCASKMIFEGGKSLAFT